MAGGIIVLRKPGTNAKGLESYLRMMIPKAQPKAFGMAIAKGGKLQIQQNNAPPTADGVIAALEVLKDSPVLMHFAMYPQTYSDADLQPMMVVCRDDDMDQPELCIAATGEFQVPNKSSHLDTWEFANSYLLEKLMGTYTALDQDLNKLIQSIRNKGFEADVSGQIKSTGTVAFLGANGEAWNILKGIKVAKDEEGWWTNNTLGWKEEDVVARDNASERTPAAQSSPKKGGFREQMAAMRNGTATIASTQPADTSGPPTTDIPEKVWREGIKAVRRWCQAACGYTPKEIAEENDISKLKRKDFLVITKTAREQWKVEHPEAKPAPKPTGVVHKTEPAAVSGSPAKKQTVAEKIAAKKAAAEAEAKAKAEAEKPETPEAEPESEGGGTVKEFVPVPPPNEREGIEPILLAAIDAVGKKIPHPKDTKETKFSSFSECFGLNSLDDIRLSKDEMWQIVQDYPVAATMLLMEYQAEREPVVTEEATPAKTTKVA